MASFGQGPFGLNPWGGGSVNGTVSVREFEAHTSTPNTITLSWKQPKTFDTSQEIVVVRRKDSFPMELFNDDALYSAKVEVSGFTDPAQVEIFRGRLYRGSNGVGALHELVDSSASFPTSPSLKGRILRDSQSRNFRIASNTSTLIVVDQGTPASGIYIILADFPNSNEQSFTGTSTSVSAGLLVDSSKNFPEHSLQNRILVDFDGDAFIIYDNSQEQIIVGGTPAAGEYTVLQEFNGYVSPTDSIQGQFQYTDDFLNKEQADARNGTGLEDEQFYYYTAFTHNLGGNVAQSTFGIIGQNNSTQAVALSITDREFGELLYSLWPQVFRTNDTTGDLEDMMTIFGSGMNEQYSYVNTFDLVNGNKMLYSLLPSNAQQLGIDQTDLVLGADTLRRIATDLLPTWKKKGSKLGIVDFIRIITTWDVTNGTKDASSITDVLNHDLILRFYSDTLGTDNTRFFGFEPTYSNSPFTSYTYNSGTGVIQYSAAVDLSLVSIGDVFTDGAGNTFDVVAVSDTLDQITIANGQTINTASGGGVYKKSPLATSGRFYSSTPGVIIPGFFDYREFVVTVKGVALATGQSTNIVVAGNSTLMTDSSANFGGTNNLVGNFLLPKQGQVNEIFVIIANSATTITVQGVVKDLEMVGEYAVLSPLNSVRFQRINELMNNYAPSFAKMGIQFTE